MIKKLNHCRLCVSKKYKPLFSKNEYDICKCLNCGFIFLDFKPGKSFFTDYYSEEFFNDIGVKHAYSNYENESKTLKKSFLLRIDVLSKYKATGSLLDVGCATGTFLECAQSSWKTSGIDISNYAIQVARKKGLETFVGEIKNSPYIKRKFDVVTLWDTIEHVSNPKETLSEINKIMPLGGILGITTGDVGSLFSRFSGNCWHLYNIPQHLSFFVKNSIAKLMKETGFEIKEILYLPLNLTLDYVLFRFITFYKLVIFQPIYKLLKNHNLLNLELNINLYDIMFVVAEKKGTV